MPTAICPECGADVDVSPDTSHIICEDREDEGEPTLSFRVGIPCSREDIPAAHESKLQELWSRVDALEDELWLPISTDNEPAARLVAQQAKYKGYLAKQRGLTVYVSRK